MNEDKEGSTAPFIDNLEIVKTFKDKAKKEKVSIIDLIN